MARPRNTADTFWSRVHKTDGCWLWRGPLSRDDGYGKISWAGVDQLAHRLSYLFSYGSIPHGLHVLHKCDTPKCVRPDHLFLGTQRTNNLDAVAKGRHRNQWSKGKSALGNSAKRQ